MKRLLLGNHGPFAFGFALRAAVWTPAQLTQVQAWWDPSDATTITLNANRVAAIADKSPNAYTLTQPVAADQLIYDTSGTVASLPMLQQNSIDSLNSTTTSLIRNTGDAYIFAIGYYPTTANSTANSMLVFVASGVSAASTRLGLTAYPTNGSNALSIGGRRLDADAYDVLPSSTTRASIQNTLFLETSRRHYAQNKTYHWTNGNIDLNGVAFPNQSAGNTSDTNPLLVSLLAPSVTLATLPDTRVGEVIICNETLSEDDRQRVEGYLAWKWGGDALWTPARLTNLAMWLDAADESTITLNGSTVSQWNDKSGNGRNASQATAALQPTYTTNGLNGKPVISFDGVDDELITIPFALGETAAMVAQRSNIDQPVIEAPIASNRGFWGSYSGFTTHLNYAVDGGSLLAAPPTSAVTTPSLVSQTGLLQTSTFAYKVGSATPGYLNLNGFIAEVVVTDNLLSTFDRQKLEGYLAWKWDLVANLPAGHPYKNQAPRL
jgi:hypothetical protein